jgi:hypothetical protein
MTLLDVRDSEQSFLAPIAGLNDFGGRFLVPVVHRVAALDAVLAAGIDSQCFGAPERWALHRSSSLLVEDSRQLTLEFERFNRRM